MEETSSMVEEDEQIYLVAEEAEVSISGKEVMVSITVIMHKAGPTTGNEREYSEITTMSLLVTRNTNWMSKRW